MGVDHEIIHGIVTSQGAYGKGVFPNPLACQEKEWKRRENHAEVLQRIGQKIISLYEPRFVTPVSTAEAIAALVTLTDSRRILELGCLTGFTTYHILRAIYGKPGAAIVAVDRNPCHDADFFQEYYPMLVHIAGSTPECLDHLNDDFDFVFIDSDHSLEHTKKEVNALMRITHPGSVLVFHDVPAWQTPDNPSPHPTRDYLLHEPRLCGLCLHSGEQADCLATFGDGYDHRLNPGLGIFLRL